MCVKNNKHRAVFLDRDGVLNRAVMSNGKPYPPRSIAEVEILPGVSESLELLKEKGFVLIVVSNQPDVARGKISMESVEEINTYLEERLPVDRFIMCYHDNSDECDCRKPHAGMLFAGGHEFDVDLERSFMIGDRWRDIEAGIAAGCRTIFIDYGYNEKSPRVYNFRALSTYEAISTILNEEIYEKD